MPGVSLFDKNNLKLGWDTKLFNYSAQRSHYDLRGNTWTFESYLAQALPSLNPCPRVFCDKTIISEPPVPLCITGVHRDYESFFHVDNYQYYTRVRM